MSPQLAALFAQHRTAILGGGVAAVAGLALLRRKKAASTPVGATAGASVPGTIPAAAVVPAGSTGAGGYDSSSFDVYNALQPELEQLRQTVGTPAAAAPTPIASTLFAPTMSGRYVSYGTAPGSPIEEIESDGSLYHLNPAEWKQVYSRGPVDAVHATGPAPTDYNHDANILASIKS